MANVFYLDVDDEITSAAARIRASEDPRVGLVVPSGSRIATSRINFRLLAREALERNRALSIVSTDPAARALAASAGLPVYATVAEYEADQGAQGDEATKAAGAPKRGRPSSGEAEAGIGLAATAASSATDIGIGGRGAGAGTGGAGTGAGAGSDGRIGARSSAASAPAVRAASRTSRASARAAATVVALVVIALVVGLIGVFLLPSATITVTPKLEAVGPLQIPIRADPTATSADPVAGVVPAVQLSKDFALSSTFNATGQKVDATAATGTVRFTNNDTSSAAVIPAGSKVSTATGVAFRTTQDVTVPSATFPAFKPGVASVGVTATSVGPAGNVAAGTIRQVPSGFSSILLKVTNQAATSGGKSTTTLQVQKKDTDAAVAALTKALKQQFTTWLAAPDALAPGSTAFPKTGVLSAPSAETDPSTLIGVTQTTFQLTMTATGTETSVDESTVTTLAIGRLRTSVPAQFSFVAGSEKVTLGTPHADGAAVVFPVIATASQVRHLDPDTLRQQVKGKSVDEARAILADDGTVDIQTWPGFVSTIPSLEWRLTLTIDTGDVSGPPGASSAPVPTGVRQGSPPPSVSSSGTP
jgi:hypothetical protein